MSQTTVNLGMVPNNRGEYNSAETYYKDNIVQYNGSSYICTAAMDLEHPSGITGVAPYDSDPTQPNTGWAVFVNNQGGGDDGIYDVSAAHMTDNTPKSYNSLSDALADIIVAKRKGGMSMRFLLQLYTVAKSTTTTDPSSDTRYNEIAYDLPDSGTHVASDFPSAFSTELSGLVAGTASYYYKEESGGTYTTWTVTKVQSSDNKYVQFRYMLPYGGNTTAENNKFVNTANWQGVDEVPTAGSENVVKSGGVYKSVKNYIEGYFVSTDGQLLDDINSIVMLDKIPVIRGHRLLISKGMTGKYLVFYNSEGSVVSSSAISTISAVVPQDATFVRTSFLKADISDAYLFDVTDNKYLFIPKDDAVSNKLYSALLSKNYIPGYIDSTGYNAGQTGSIVPYPWIMVSPGDTISWDKTKGSGNIEFLNSEMQRIDYFSATAYSSRPAPANTQYIRIGFIKGTGAWVKVNGVLVWQEPEAENVPELSEILAILKYGDVANNKERINELKSKSIIPQNYIDGYKILNTGSLSADSAAISMADFIPCANGDAIVVNSGYSQFCIYNASGTKLDNWGLTGAGNRTFTISYSGDGGPVAKCRCSFIKASRTSALLKINGTIVYTPQDEVNVISLNNRCDEIEQEINEVQAEGINYISGLAITSTGGTTSNINAFIPKDIIPCAYGDKIVVNNGVGYLVVFDSNDTVLDYWGFTDELTNRAVDLTASKFSDASYCKCSFALNKIKEATITNGEEILWAATSIELGISETKLIANNLINLNNEYEGVVSWYKDYIKSKCADIFKKDVAYKSNGDSFIFLTDYHVPDVNASGVSQFRHSPALVRYIQKHTQTKKFIFGGDTVCSPTDADRYERMRLFLSDFRETNMYPVIGNHEWRNSSYRGAEAIARDYATLCSELNDVVFDDTKMPYYCFDNEEMRIRYIILNTPEMVDTPGGVYDIYYSSNQLPFLRAKALEVGSEWGVVIIQHIIGQADNSTFDDNDEPIVFAYSPIKTTLENYLGSLMEEENCPKILGVISGHAHCDWIDYSTNGYPIIVTTDDATYKVVDGNIDVKYPNQHIREKGTINEQAFDIMHVSFDENKWDLTRIGYGKNRIVRLTGVTVSVGGTATITPTIDLVDSEGGSYEWWIKDTGVATCVNGVVTGVSAGHTVVRVANDANYDEQTTWEYVHIIVTE